MKNKLRLLIILLCIIAVGGISGFIFFKKTIPNQQNTIKIAAFNIQIFGKSKREKLDIMDILSKTVRQFDVVLIQELRDKEEKTAEIFLSTINNDGHKYNFIKSPRLGSTNSKEAYAYFYNTKTVKFVKGSAFVYEEKNINDFEREPFIATFKSGNFDFTLVGIHTKPDNAEKEIAKLDEVVVWLQTKAEKDIIVLGDFNADGSYFDEDNSSHTFHNSKYYWIITNDMDTMTTTDNTYDRIVLTDDTLNHEYIKNSAQVFYFDQVFGTPKKLTKKVSDHYPVFAEFKTNLRDDD